ncbi:hypothetical protein, partial [Pseudactinotalea sp.]|uniref:hypothetical protein n=1 Tax=Pseudactinotalea sp. TaxID=1926260 RepID=UPI003B3BBBB7
MADDGSGRHPMFERTARRQAGTPVRTTSERALVVDQILRGIRSGRGSLVLGAAGVGKTSLTTR